jgi:uncharacterized protein YkwD
MRAWGAAAVLLALVLATGASARSDLAGDVIDEINRVRADPQRYAQELRDYRARIDGLIAYPDDAPDGVMTHEGTSAVDEAILFLENQRPLPPLGASRLLAAGAGDLVADEGPSGRIGHYTAAGMDPGARVRRHGGDIYVGEVIAYGPRDPRSVVRQLLVDDGVPGRGHRKLLFAPAYRYAGAACGMHVRFGSMCVVDLAGTADGRPRMPASSGPVDGNAS